LGSYTRALLVSKDRRYFTNYKNLLLYMYSVRTYSCYSLKFLIELLVAQNGDVYLKMRPEDVSRKIPAQKVAWQPDRQHCSYSNYIITSSRVEKAELYCVTVRVRSITSM
jgi:hypothetical protein